MSLKNDRHSEVVHLLLAGIVILAIAVVPAFAQAGGEVLDVKVTHVVSSIGAPTPPDEIHLRLRVVDQRGHAFTQVFTNNAVELLFDPLSRLRKPTTPPLDRLSESDTQRWLAGGEERRRLLIDLYIPMFRRLDEDVAHGRTVSINTRVDPQKAQGYITLADIAAEVKARAIVEARAIEGVADIQLKAEAAEIEPKAEAAKKCPESATLEVIHRVEPKYSEEARKARHEGTVILQITVQTDGSVAVDRIIRSPDFDDLSENAIAAIKEWKFAPVGPCTITLPAEVNFRLGRRPGAK